MMFKKLNFFEKAYLKHSDKPAYKQYKWELNNLKKLEIGKTIENSGRLNSIPKIIAFAKANHRLNIVHSGNAGDIIYALPTIKKIHEITGVPVNLYFKLDKPSRTAGYQNHPLGDVMLNKKMVDMLIPLISRQNYIAECKTHIDELIDVDLDYFREGLVPQDKGNIARWCGYITGVSPDLWKKWIIVTSDDSYADFIVIARSGRYNNQLIDYSFLSKYKKIVFLGVADELKAIKAFIPEITWIQVTDFSQMAQIIAGAKLFIGNQSFPYAIAEAMKVPRILELSYQVINVIPEGENGHDFLFQQHFEYLVEELCK